MEEINAVTPQQLDTLRRNFNEKVVSTSPGFHPDDLERVKSDDLWLRRWVAAAEFNMDTALTLLFECCQWRKEFGTNELDERQIQAEIFEKGTLFIRNKDKWGKKLLIFKAKTHTKGSLDTNMMQKHTVYFFERIERESNSDQITIMFDMKDTGWNNMDMDFVRYLITLLKTYYPYFVNYMIIFEMPWLLNAAWKIIKTWLPAKFVDRVKFLDKKTLKDFIDVDNQLAEWGGNDNYVYKFEPASKSKRNFNNNNNNVNANGFVPEARTAAKVQFTGSETHQIDYYTPERTTMSTPSPTPNGHQDQQTAAPNQSHILVDVDERITFRSSADDQQYAAELVVTNISPNGDTLIVKIKATAPEKYRVRPIVLLLRRSARAVVQIETHPEISATTLTRDRFQVQVAVLPPNMQPQSGSDSDGSFARTGELANVFRTIQNSGTCFETYRVSVSAEARQGDLGPGGGGPLLSLTDERLRTGLEDLEKKITDSVSERMDARIQALERKCLIAAVILGSLVLIIMTYFYFSLKSSGCPVPEPMPIPGQQDGDNSGWCHTACGTCGGHQT